MDLDDLSPEYHAAVDDMLGDAAPIHEIVDEWSELDIPFFEGFRSTFAENRKEMINVG